MWAASISHFPMKIILEKYTINWNTWIILIIPNTVSRLGAVGSSGKTAAKAYFVYNNSLNLWLRLETGAGLNGASRDVH